MLALWVHDINPVAVDLGFIAIRWYGLSYLLGFAIGYLLVRRVTQVGESTLKPQHAADFIVACAIGIVVGGRLGYVLFYDPQLMWTWMDEAPWWGVLAINHGGMASHGGMIGLFAATLYFAKRHGHRWGHLMDLGAFAAPLGLFFGRIANFINGELLGRPVDQGSIALRWAVKFPQELYDQADAAEQAVGLLQAAGYTPGHGRMDPVTWIIEQVQRGNEAVRQIIEPVLTPRHPSQLYAAVMEGLIVFAVLLWVWRKPRRPWTVGGWFGVSYAVMRILDEHWRLPDVQLGYQLLGLTRGQWLSAGLLAVGAGLLWWSRCQGPMTGNADVPRLGGWRRRGT
jgi:phosphatidylglycerol:prolipoprotein diacylglycerol transferase